MDTPTLSAKAQDELQEQHDRGDATHAGDDAAVDDRKRQEAERVQRARARSDWQKPPMMKTRQEIARWRRDHPTPVKEMAA